MRPEPIPHFDLDTDPADDFEPTFVYRFFAPDGDLLYVGSTRCPADRFRAHRATAWWHIAARYTLESYPTRRDARAAEAKAIRDECPRANHMHNWHRIPAVMAMVDADEEFPPAERRRLAEDIERAWWEELNRNVSRRTAEITAKARARRARREVDRVPA